MRSQLMFAIYAALILWSVWSVVDAIRTARATDFESQEETQRHPVDFGLSVLSRVVVLGLSLMGCAYQLGYGVDPLAVLRLTGSGQVVEASGAR
jgi:hypothetical protein